MRYYSIIITNPKTGELVSPPVFKNLKLGATYTSLVNGKTIPGALNVEFDIPVATLGSPMGTAFVRIWGVTLYEISQSYQINGMAVKVYGGFQKGLPLATSAFQDNQAGLLVQGYVFPAIGNWIGNAMTLDLAIVPFPTKYTPSETPLTTPPNLTLTWKKGTKLSDAIMQALGTAYPGSSTSVSINDKLVASEDVTGFFSDLTSFSQFVRNRSTQIVGGDYTGVEIATSQGNFSVFDGTGASASVKTLRFQDFVGQPTWIDPATVQSHLMMRADLKIGDYIRFPSTPVAASPQSVSPFVNQKLTFQGDFLVKKVRHVGNYRQEDAEAWVTVVDASTVPVAVSQ